MRLQHWIVPVIGIAMALGSVRHASAQYDPTRVVPADDPFAAGAGGSPFPYYDPKANNGAYPVMQTGYAQPPGPPAGGPPGDWIEPGQVSNYSPVLLDPPASASYPDPNVFGPYPKISPFEHRFQQHTVEKGLWFQQTNDGPNRHYFTADVIVARFDNSEERTIGDLPPLGPFPFPPEITFNTADVFNHLDFSVGLELRLGVNRPDNSGFELEGFYSGLMEDTQRFNINGYIGEIAYHIQTGGGEAVRFFTPFYDRGPTQMRALAGVRYMGIDELLHFQFTDVLTFADGNFTEELKLQTMSSMIGPELGFQLEAGGDTATLRTETKVALLANHEQINRQYVGFGEPNVASLIPLAFAQEDNRATWHMSPLFEQSISFEIALFEHIPVVKRCRLLEDARFRAGYTFVAVGEIARATNQLEYQVGTQKINGTRTHFLMDYWNFGVEWRR